MSRMIFPARLETAPILQRLSKRRLLAESNDDALPVSRIKALTPVIASKRRFPQSSFSAQLLALGLRYGMDDLVNKADVDMPHAEAEDAAKNYEKAQGAYINSNRPPLFARWSA
jgi:hypothetical protein